MNADGSNVRRLTTFGFCYGAHFSPDGTQIVFSHQVNEDALSDLWIMNADGSNPRNLTNTTDNIESEPVFSPDGQKIAYLFAWPGGFEIYTMNVDGTNRTPLTARHFDLSPGWSPDGQKLAFTRATASGFEIFTVPVTGGEPTQLTSGTERINLSPVWSPDGSQIAFTALAPREQWQVYIMNADGANQHVVVPGVGSDRGNSTGLAAWKNGKLLIAGYRGNWDIFFGDPGSNQLFAVTDHPLDDKPTDWRP
jgi:Tol biopolymer transport system component